MTISLVSRLNWNHRRLGLKACIPESIPIAVRVSSVGQHPALGNFTICRSSGGLFDMHGNAWQWCWDWFDEEYYATSPKNDPNGPDSGDGRVLRGGSWFDWPLNSRSATRGGDFRFSQNLYAGFRVARTK